MASTSGKLYRIEEDAVCGRQLVARRHIKAGELIIDEPALLTGPGFGPGTSYFNDRERSESSTGESDGSPTVNDKEENSVCLVCCTNLNLVNCVKCSSCELLLCSFSCQTSAQHSQNECLIFPKLGNVWNANGERSKKSLYNLVLVIRGLFYKIREPAKWDQIQMLESKWDALEKIGVFAEFIDVFNCLSWDLLFSSARSSLGESSPEINGNDHVYISEKSGSIINAAKHCLGVMRINAFSSFSESYSREGLFFLSSFMSHSCVINTDRQMDVWGGGCVGYISGSRMVVRASVDIEKDKPITTTYLSLLYNTEERSMITIGSWLFTCHCRRCKDPNELQTFLSSVTCQKKNNYSSYPLDANFSSLVCETDCLMACKGDFDLSQITLSRPKNIFKIKELEDWLDKYDNGKTLHPYHSMFTHLKLFLCQYYGRQNGGLEAVGSSQLKRKALYCQQILAVYNNVTPGIQLCRGVILFELWCALRKLAEHNHLPVHITYPLSTTSNCNNQLSLISTSLKFEETDIKKIKMEALNILRYALPNSSEEAMALLLQEEDDL